MNKLYPMLIIRDPPDKRLLPVACGPIMLSFSGNSFFPHLYHDMRDSNRYHSLVDLTFAILTLLYGMLTLYNMFVLVVSGC